MKTIIMKNGKMNVPIEYDLSRVKRRLTITTPFCKKIDMLCKDGRVTTQMYFRHKQLKQKPYIPDGFIEIDGERFKIIEDLQNNRR